MYQDSKKASSMPLIPIFLIVLVVVVAMGAMMSTPKLKFTSHSRTSHEEQITRIEDCFKDPDRVSSFFLMGNGRYSQYCEGENNNHWRIMECENGDLVVVTQFKQALRKLANYITNHQMEPVPVPQC